MKEMKELLEAHTKWASDWKSGKRLAWSALTDQEKANLRKADLRGADLMVADLDGADLSGADLREIDLQGADLVGASLGGANLSEAKMSEANLRGANLRGATLEWADLRNANLHEADLTGANLTGANLRKADLTGANLRGANLTEVRCTLSTPELIEAARASLTAAQNGEEEEERTAWVSVSMGSGAYGRRTCWYQVVDGILVLRDEGDDDNLAGNSIACHFGGMTPEQAKHEACIINAEPSGHEYDGCHICSSTALVEEHDAPPGWL